MILVRPSDNGTVASVSSINEAVTWVEQLLIGTIGTSVAVCGVALLGISLLFGRVSVRDGLRVILGCFLLFGAPILAAGLVGSVRSQSSSTTSSSPIEVAAPKLPQKEPQYDPYAGAAVPDRGATWP